MNNLIIFPIDRGMRNEIPVPPEWAEPTRRYIATLRLAGAPKPTLTLRSYHLRRFAADCRLSPWTVTTGDLLDHIERNTWSPSMVKSFRSTMRGFYAWAKATGQARKNPAKNLPVVRVPQGTPRPAKDTQLDAALAGADDRVRLMLRLAAEAGLRCREIALVHRDDLVRDLTGWSLIVHGKGDKDRLVPLDDSLAADTIARGAGWVFPGQIDGHLSAAYISKLLSRHIDGATAHQLRHRFATRAYQRGGHDIRGVQQLLGHASVATTQIYVAPDQDNLRRIALAAA